MPKTASTPPRRRLVSSLSAVAGSAVSLAAALALTACGSGKTDLSAPTSSATTGAVSRPDHIVVVVEENHSASDIIGDTTDAPYINSLARQGANLTRFYAETHPSQPNYLALFSGSTHGVTSDDCPQHLSGPNLGAELLAAGKGFTGYSEGLPAPGSTTCGSGDYARKHNPWVNFGAIPPSANQPFSAFPRTPQGFASLPAVSFVIPNLQHDMHDGSVAQGDSWLKDNLDGYLQWARTHRSLLVVTWDEDDDGSGNRIPTVIAGAGVKPGSYDERVDHYNLLRTIENAYSLAPAGGSATAAPITDIWG